MLSESHAMPEDTQAPSFVADRLIARQQALTPQGVRRRAAATRLQALSRGYLARSPSGRSGRFSFCSERTSSPSTPASRTTSGAGDSGRSVHPVMRDGFHRQVSGSSDSGGGVGTAPPFALHPLVEKIVGSFGITLASADSSARRLQAGTRGAIARRRSRLMRESSTDLGGSTDPLSPRRPFPRVGEQPWRWQRPHSTEGGEFEVSEPSLDCAELVRHMLGTLGVERVPCDPRGRERGGAGVGVHVGWPDNLLDARERQQTPHQSSQPPSAGAGAIAARVEAAAGTPSDPAASSGGEESPASVRRVSFGGGEPPRATASCHLAPCGYPLRSELNAARYPLDDTRCAAAPPYQGHARGSSRACAHALLPRQRGSPCHRRETRLGPPTQVSPSPCQRTCRATSYGR